MARIYQNERNFAQKKNIGHDSKLKLGDVIFLCSSLLFESLHERLHAIATHLFTPSTFKVMLDHCKKDWSSLLLQ